MSTPTSPRAPTGRPPSRRRFFRWLTAGLGAVATFVVAAPLVRYLFGQRKRAAPWVNLGRLEEFQAGETRLMTFDNPLRRPWDGITAQTGVYVRREHQEGAAQEQFLVFAVNCAHLGCPVSWFPQSGLFMCPCHGGVYYANGERASGPPPRGLFHCAWRVRKGRLEVQAPHYPTLYDTLESSPREGRDDGDELAIGDCQPDGEPA